MRGCEGVARTTGQLFVSRPTLAGRLGGLRGRLNFSPFSHARDPVDIAPRNRVFLSFTQHCIRLRDRVVSDLQRFGRVPTRPMLVTAARHNNTCTTIRTTPFVVARPRVRLDCLGHGSRRYRRRLRDRSISLTVCARPMRSRGVRCVPMRRSPLMFIVPRRSPVLRSLSVSSGSLRRPIRVSVDHFHGPSLQCVLTAPNRKLCSTRGSFFEGCRVAPVRPRHVSCISAQCLITYDNYNVTLLPRAAVHGSSANRGPICNAVGNSALCHCIVITQGGNHGLPPSTRVI